METDCPMTFGQVVCDWGHLNGQMTASVLETFVEAGIVATSRCFDL
jgi:hypothetical protein